MSSNKYVKNQLWTLKPCTHKNWQGWWKVEHTNTIGNQTFCLDCYGKFTSTIYLMEEQLNNDH